MRLSSASDILVTAWTAKLMEQELHDNVGVAVNESVALSPTLGRNLSEDHLRNLVSHQRLFREALRKLWRSGYYSNRSNQQANAYNVTCAAFGSIIPDKTNSTITVENSGIGMTKNENVNHLGTIATTSP